MHRIRWIVLGAAAAVLSRRLLERAVLAKFRRDVERLNAGDYRPLLSGYADDAVLIFNDGPHRFSGTHRGRRAIEAFLADFTRAGLTGEVRALWLGGPPWAMTLVARFDDEASDERGTRVYANRVVIVARTRWGRIVEHEDFYEDTGRIVELERSLAARGIHRVGDAVPGAVPGAVGDESAGAPPRS